MDLEALVGRLISVDAGTRDLDLEVAKAIGWTVQTGVVADGVGKAKHRLNWILPHSNNVTGKVPDYTTSIQAAYQCAESLFPGHVGGCSWETGHGTASINYGKFVRAATPALALCVAALIAKLKSDGAPSVES